MNLLIASRIVSQAILAWLIVSQATLASHVVKQQVACRQSFYTLFTSTTPPAKSSTYGNREFYWSSSEWVRVFLPIYESEKGIKALPLLCCEKRYQQQQRIKRSEFTCILVAPNQVLLVALGDNCCCPLHLFGTQIGDPNLKPSCGYLLLRAKQ